MLSYLKLGLKSLCLVLLPFIDGFSQVLRLDNGLLTVNNLSYVYVDGSIESNLASVFQINGNDNMQDAIVTVNGNVVNNADLQLNGKLKLFGNWFNNETFQSNTGHLFLEGAIQELGGINPSNFHHLTLNGTDYKFQSNHQSCYGNLNLNTLELRTETYRFSVLNTNSNAVTRQEITPTSGGMVSSLNGGFFQRNTNSTNGYLFPVGSTTPNYRYRPVLIQPITSSNSAFDVRFAPLNATIENFDLQNTIDTFCQLNANYYHQIGSTETIPVNLTISTILAEDGSWNGLSRWQLQSILGWSIIQNTVSNNANSFLNYTINNWNNFSAKPYILHREAPSAFLSGNYAICQGENVQIPISANGNPPFTFTITDGQGTIFNQNSSSLPAFYAVSPNVSTTYSITTVQDANCINETNSPNAAAVQVTQLPIIDVSIQPVTGFAPLSVQFQNQSQFASNYAWDFGNGQTSNLPQPNTVYENEGSYLVQLIAENNGCFAQNSWTINVAQSPLEIFVPNVFTVNNDAINDEWGIQVKGALSCEVLIVNRWGNVMKELSQINETWDGKVRGNRATDGVYFYKYKIIDLNNQPHEGHGHFTLISNE
jgi:gliding motility-associated-like protein